MIDLGTLGGLLAHRHELQASCPHCDRWRGLPLDDLVAAGHGNCRPPITAWCRVCGALGRVQVRPPVPTRGLGGDTDDTFWA